MVDKEGHFIIDFLLDADVTPTKHKMIPHSQKVSEVINMGNYEYDKNGTMLGDTFNVLPSIPIRKRQPS